MPNKALKILYGVTCEGLVDESDKSHILFITYPLIHLAELVSDFFDECVFINAHCYVQSLYESIFFCNEFLLNS